MATVKIGWGRRELSMEGPIFIPGQMYMRVSVGIHDPLYATALCLDGGTAHGAVIFCTMDMTSLRNTMDDVIARARELRPEIPEGSIIIGATHTHSAMQPLRYPSVAADGQPLFPWEKVRAHVVEQTAQAIAEAWDSRRPGAIAYGYGYAVVAHSRRVVYFDDVSLRKPNAVSPNGHGVMYGNTNDSQFSHYEAGADHFLNALYTLDEAGKLTGIVCNVPCPSQLSEHFNQLSADFWCEVREGVEQEFGRDVYLLAQCACAGDLSPRTLHYRGAQARRMHYKYDLGYNIDGYTFAPDVSSKEKIQGVASDNEYRKVMAERKDIAERILASLKEIWSWAQKDVQADVVIRHRTDTVPLAKRMITDEEKQWCEQSVEKLANAIPTEGDPAKIVYAQTMYNSVKGRNESAVRRWNAQKDDPVKPTILHVVQVGEIAFASNPFELYMDFQHRIQARSPFIQTFLIELAGDDGPSTSYLATERGAANKGYSASLFDNIVSAEGGQQLVNYTVDVLNELKASE